MKINKNSNPKLVKIDPQNHENQPQLLKINQNLTKIMKIYKKHLIQN